MSPNNEKSHEDRNCAFCKEEIMSEEYRLLEADDYSFVMLDKNPKVSGHILIISKNPHNDITYLQLGSKESKSIMNTIIKWSKVLKLHVEETYEKQNPEKPRTKDDVAKVYVMTMCDHWKPEEISTNWKKGGCHPETTEHLHFYLLPRYIDMRKKEIAGEKFFTRSGDEEWSNERFESMKNQLQKACRRLFPPKDET